MATAGTKKAKAKPTASKKAVANDDPYVTLDANGNFTQVAVQNGRRCYFNATAYFAAHPGVTQVPISCTVGASPRETGGSGTIVIGTGNIPRPKPKGK